MRPGFVYALWSDGSEYIKLGRTSTSPHQRLAEVNGSAAYGRYGPWRLLTCQKVKDCTAIESALHLRAGRRVDVGTGATELFALTRAQALELLETIPAAELFEPLPVERLKVDTFLMQYLLCLFEQTGLEAFLDQQEAWTFSLFPSTSGGRSYTVNIGRHEVAFSDSVARAGEPIVHHALVVDRLVERDPETADWLSRREGEIAPSGYASAMDDAVVVWFRATFEDALGLFDLPGVRRAVIAYWFDALLRMRATGARSFFARRHNYSAVAAILRHLRETRRFRAGV